MARVSPVGLVLALGAGSVACERATGPVVVSYLAVVAQIDAREGVTPGTRFTYRVTELSGTLGIDTVIAVAPTDTVILRMPGATYRVSLEGLRPTCVSRYGPTQFVVVVEGGHTSLARYFISCQPPLEVRTLTDGANIDPEFIYRLRATGGDERVGLIGANDTLLLDGLASGEYTISLHHVAGHCVVTSDGGPARSVHVDSAGGTQIDLRVTCSDEAQRPRLLAFAASYHDGVSAFVFRAADVGRDIERYHWDLTDCQGISLVGGARLRRGLSAGRTRNLDTIIVVGAHEVGLPDGDLQGRACTALRVVDENGNTTPIVQVPIGTGGAGTGGSAPRAVTFNARLVDTLAVRTQLAATDAEGDFAGTFAMARLRDGVLSAPNGEPDLGIFSAAGYLDTQIPDLPLGSRIHYGDVYAVIVYLIDAAGNFARIEDADVFR